MKKIEQLSIECTEKLRKCGDLKLIAEELVPKEHRFSIDEYLQERAGQLLTDVIGIPSDIRNKYAFYRTNLAQVMRMPVPNLKRDKREYAQAA